MTEEVKQASLAECNSQLFASLLATPEPAEPVAKARAKKAAEPAEAPTEPQE